MNLKIRPATSEDINAIAELDHSYETDSVWQMELETEIAVLGARFRSTRLPRPMKVAYPRNVEKFLVNWKKEAALMIAEQEDKLLGYVAISTQIAPNSAWLTNWAVPKLSRRNGIGSQLLMAAQKWAINKGLQKILLEMQSKNMPAVRLAQKMAFEFSGYSDRFYENQDIALFFSKNLV